MSRSVHPFLAFLAAAVAVVLPACSGDGGNAADASSDVPADTAVADDAATDLLPADAASDPGGTGIDANAPGHPHPYWKGVTWDTAWPGIGYASATYSVVTTSDQTHKDVPARVTEPVTMLSGKDPGYWTRLAFGSMEPPLDGMAVYFDRSTPWKVRVKGIEMFDNTYLEPRYEIFDRLVEIPLDLPVGSSTSIEAEVTTNVTGSEKVVDVTLQVQAVSYDADCPQPFANDTGCATLRVTLDGGLVGGNPLVSLIVLHPVQHIVSWMNAPAYSSMVITRDGWSD